MKLRLINQKRAVGKAVIFSLMSLITLGSCVRDKVSDEPDIKDDEAMVTLQLKAPYFAQPTRTISSAIQATIQTLDVLAFRVDDSDGDGNPANDPETFDYYAPTYKDGVQHKAKVIIKSYPQRFVVIANASEKVRMLVESFRGTEALRETMLKELKAELAAGALWSATDDLNYTPLPMYGESTPITVSPSTTAMGTIIMVRMLSKIEVVLKDELFTTKKFQLRSIHVYNTNTSGRIAPIIDAADTYFDRLGNIAKAPSLPQSVVANTNPLVYISDIATQGQKMVDGIFTFEAAAATSANSDKQPSIVVGGIFKEEMNGGNEVVTYYRVDFMDGAMKYIPLLRNHTYTVSVLDVSRRGFDTPDDAFAAGPINITAIVAAWNSGMWEEVSDDGQFKMAVSDKGYNFSKELNTGKLTISTDWIAGLESVKFSSSLTNSDAGGATWLSQTTLTPDAGNGVDGLKKYELLFGASANTGAPRTGYIHLLAGRMHMVVRVDQSDVVISAIDITDIANNDISILEFTAAKDVQPIQQQFKINWSPTTQDLNFNTSSMTNAFTFAAGAGLDVIPASGTLSSIDNPKSYTIRPTAITTADLAADPFYERTSTILYTVTDGLSMATKTLNLRQIVPNLVTDANTYYLLNGSRYTFNVRSNAAWRIKSVTPSQSGLLNLQALDNLQVGTSGSYDTGVGLPINFTVSNNTALSGKVTLVFESTALPQLFSDITVEFALLGEYYPTPHTGWAGSNIYWDGSKLTFAAVDDQSKKNYQGVYFHWGSLYGISPVGAWSATTILYTPQGTAAAANSLGFGAWSSWPRHPDTNVTSSPPAGKTARDRAYLYEVTDGATGIGDICKYLTEKGWAPGSPATKWRQPTSMEFEAASSYANYGTWTGVTSNQANGTFAIANGKTKTGIGSPSFPAAGFRLYNDGALINAGMDGYYWSATADGGGGYTLDFYRSSVYPSSSNSRAVGSSVRCVKE